MSVSCNQRTGGEPIRLKSLTSARDLVDSSFPLSNRERLESMSLGPALLPSLPADIVLGSSGRTSMPRPSRKYGTNRKTFSLGCVSI